MSRRRGLRSFNGRPLSSLHSGRGRTPDAWADNYTNVNLEPNNTYIREIGQAPIDSVSFHYSVYRSLIPFLGLDGNPFPENDATGLSFASLWETMMLYVVMTWTDTGHQTDRRSPDPMILATKEMASSIRDISSAPATLMYFVGQVSSWENRGSCWER